jgi:hypothetical protein
MKMDKRTMILVGTGLMGLGVLWLMLGLVASLFGINLLGFALRFWPVLVSAAGLAFVLPPLLVHDKRGLGGLFIPGVPILVIGGILLVASVLNAWGIWAWLWPMVLLAVAIGFVAAALYMDVSGLLIPATIVGLNGLVFQFCAVTGLWGWWSVLWTIEPLSVGLALLLVAARTNSPGMVKAGLILCAVAAGGFLLMVTILAGGWLFGLVGPGLIILAGLGLLAWGLARGRLLPRSATE